jgi:hypothetical protein
MESEIRGTLDGMIQALNSGDRERVRTVLARSEEGIHIGTDEREWLTNDQLVESLGDNETSGIRIVVEDWSIHCPSGDTAWAAGLAHFEDDTRQSSSVRLSAVLSREGGHWMVAHSHASIGVPNNQLFDERSSRS